MRASRLRAALFVVLIVASAVLLSSGAYLLQLRGRIAELTRPRWGTHPGGVLILCGGSTMSDEVRDCFLECAGGRQARLIVIPAYRAGAADKTRLADTFNDRRVTSITVLDAATPEEAESKRTSETLADATGVWLSGGDQSYLADVYWGTQVERQLKALLARGGVICGTSAGAAVMTRVMIRGSGIDTERRGFDLLPDTIVDQHFFQRNRPQRLLAALAERPQLVGVGVDEGTAVVVENGGKRWTVIGRSYVMVCLPSDASFPRVEVLKPGESTNIELLKAQPGIIAINSPTLMDDILYDTPQSQAP
jgi:cyanophycinase